jgi:2-amino-4-hydroxy-6-hydroxymethyldihydropteridine diphosphokinase
MAEAKTSAILALGSSIEPRLRYLQRAVLLLEAEPQVLVTGRSRIYESQSVEGGGEGDFLNAAVEIETALSPRDLLLVCQSIESTCGREIPVAGQHRHGARTLDIDIVSFGDENCCDRALLLPHPRALRRAFVLRPVLDLLGENGGWVRETELNWTEE